MKVNVCYNVQLQLTLTETVMATAKVTYTSKVTAQVKETLTVTAQVRENLTENLIEKLTETVAYNCKRHLQLTVTTNSDRKLTDTEN